MKHLSLILTLLFVSPTFAQDGKPPQTQNDVSIRGLVSELGADDYNAREAAQAQLLRLGKDAATKQQVLAALKANKDHQDPEIASRVAELLRSLGEKQPQPREQDKPAPSPRTPAPTPEFNPDDLEEMLKGLKGMEDQIPQLQEMMEKLRELMDGQGQPGTPPGLPNLGELFDRFFGDKTPQTQPRVQPQPGSQSISPIESSLGIRLSPVPDVLRAHLKAPAPKLGSGEGFYIKSLAPGHAKQHGLQQHDIIVSVAENGKPAQVVTSATQLALVKKGNVSLRIIRGGAPQTLTVPKLPAPAQQNTPKQQEKQRDF
jgi:hypothetical protein